jgi:catechol 2,3-dioxygenase-like lactoylglutathione lyase family enzyme
MLQIKDSNVTIMVNDMDKAIQFYESIGLTVKQRWGNNYAMVGAPGITLGIHPGEGRTTSSGSVSIGFFIEAIGDAKALLDSHNIDYKEENDGKSGLYLHFKDPDGTILYFVQPQW